VDDTVEETSLARHGAEVKVDIPVPEHLTWSSHRSSTRIPFGVSIQDGKKSDRKKSNPIRVSEHMENNHCSFLLRTWSFTTLDTPGLATAGRATSAGSKTWARAESDESRSSWSASGSTLAAGTGSMLKARAEMAPSMESWSWGHAPRATAPGTSDMVRRASIGSVIAIIVAKGILRRSAVKSRKAFFHRPPRSKYSWRVRALV